MQIRSVRRKRKSVAISYVKSDGEIHSVVSNEAPLPSFDKAIAALTPLILAILHLPEGYGVGLKPTGLTIAGKGDAANQVVLTFQKDIEEANGPWNSATPLRFLEHPSTEGTYTPALTDAQVELVSAVLEEAKEYAVGNRMQGVLLGDTSEQDCLAAEAKARDNHDPLQSELLGDGPAGTELSQDSKGAQAAIDAANAQVAPKKRGRKPKVAAPLADVPAD
jgi:hypothetical protein